MGQDPVAAAGGELPHAAEIAAIQSQIDDDVETHLYLTDYRSLHESGTCAAWWPTTRPA